VVLAWRRSFTRYEAIAELAMRSPLEAALFTVLLVGVLVLIEVLNYRRQKRRDEASLLQVAAEA